MPSFVRLEVWDRLQCQGGAKKRGVLYPADLANGKDVQAITDQESLTFAFTRVDRTGAVRPIVANLLARTIATIVWSDGSFDERRVSLIEDGQAIGGLITVTANPLILDLAEGADSATGKGLVSAMANCLRVFSFSALDLTATNVWDTYVIPACPAWVSRGTIDPAVTIPLLTWDRLTPQALALQVRDTLVKMNTPCELRLRRNGVTDYKLDLVTQVGASASVPLFHPRSSLQSLKRKVDTTQQATRLFVSGQTDPSGTAGILGRARWAVTNVNGGTLKVTLADPNGGLGPIGMTDQWENFWMLRVKTGRTFPVQAADAAAQTVTLLDVSTIAAGETIEFRLTEPLTNARGTGIRYSVTQVGASAEYIQLAGGPVTIDGQWTDWYARVWTASVGGTIRKDIRINTSTASNNRVAVGTGNASGVLLSDYVELIQLDGAGEIPSYLEHPAALTTYGAKTADLAVSAALGVAQLVPNGWMRAWSNGSNPADGWAIGGAPTFSRNSNPAFTRYGGYSQYIEFGPTIDFSKVLSSPLFYPALAAGNTRISVRAQVYFSAIALIAAQNFQFAMSACSANPNGTLGAAIGSAWCTGVGGSGPPGTAVVGPGVWITMEIVGLDLALTSAFYGLGVTFSAGGNTPGTAITCSVYVDTVEVFGFVSSPTTIYEYGDATVLEQAGNRQLVMNGMPPITYELSIADLERSDPVTWARNALTIGGSVRAVDPELGVDTTVRLLRLERDLLRPKASTVGLATLPPLLTQVAQTV